MGDTLSNLCHRCRNVITDGDSGEGTDADQSRPTGKPALKSGGSVADPPWRGSVSHSSHPGDARTADQTGGTDAAGQQTAVVNVTARKHAKKVLSSAALDKVIANPRADCVVAKVGAKADLVALRFGMTGARTGMNTVCPGRNK